MMLPSLCLIVGGGQRFLLFCPSKNIIVFCIYFININNAHCHIFFLFINAVRTIRLKPFFSLVLNAKHIKSSVPLTFGTLQHCWTCCVCLGNPTITPRRILRSQWFHDPWTCGSYSYPGKGCSVHDLYNLMEPLPWKGEQSQVYKYAY